MPDRPRWRWPKRLLVAAVAVSAAIAIANLYLLRATRAQVIAAVDGAPVRSVVIVLGNIVLPNGRPGRELLERLETGYALYHAGRAPRILVSGMARAGYDEPQSMATWLVERGVPRADIVLDGGGHRTAASMADAAALGMRTALIATQEYHLPRAIYLARSAGIDAVGVSARPAGGTMLREIRTHLRECLARAETLVEVAVRGVRR
jgi:SanA protein